MSYNFYLTIKWMKRKCKDLHCRKNSSYIYESEYYRGLEGGLFYLETVNNHPQHCGNHLITSYTVKKKGVFFFTEKESKFATTKTCYLVNSVYSVKKLQQKKIIIITSHYM